MAQKKSNCKQLSDKSEIGNETYTNVYPNWTIFRNVFWWRGSHESIDGLNDLINVFGKKRTEKVSDVLKARYQPIDGKKTERFDKLKGKAMRKRKKKMKREKKQLPCTPPSSSDHEENELSNANDIDKMADAFLEFLENL